MLSSLSVAAGSVSTSHVVSDPSRSPFQVDRDKVRAQTGKVEHLTPSVSASQELNRTTIVPSVGQSVVTSPVQQKPPVAGAYNPWLTLNLQESHLLSQDIESWAKSQSMRLLWNSNRDYLIYSSIHLTGKNRDEVLNELGQLFRSENYGLVVKLYEKNNVLVIDGQ
ncbi:pilus assembly protein [Salmonella enterica subsp. enterica serovar Infantis]|nr:pilus assembly protein [Salmonella enterica subsp. enterica serovar Infantis]ECO1013051.1 pilus assembly protein [Salmonella enterica subsp. enterica serovar Newport]EGI5077302.1 pilus assembly protein [Salmonella enterica subsp. enterica serovar Infantis]